MGIVAGDSIANVWRRELKVSRLSPTDSDFDVSLGVFE